MSPRPKPGWLVYVLRCGDGSLYTGITNDLPKRLAAHAAGKASKYTRSRLPVRLAHAEPQRSKSAALKREAAIKKLSRRRKDLLVRSTANRITGRQGTRTPNPLGVNEVL
jgi:putative endonuclease